MREVNTVLGIVALCLWFPYVLLEDNEFVCPLLRVEGPTVYASVNGEYTLHSCVYNGRPVYKHNQNDLYLFYITGEMDFWLIGPNVGVKAGYLLAHESTDSPLDVRGRWRRLSSQDGVWEDEYYLLLKCQVCSSVTIWTSNTTLPEGTNGTYRQQQILYNQKPIYKHLSNDSYIYFQHSSKCDHYWTIGRTIGEDSGLIRSYDFAQAPDVVTADWLVSHDDNWMSNSDVRVTCSDTPSIQCGESGPKPKVISPFIIQGNDVEYSEKWPWMVSIQNNGLHICGGVLISPTWVLTAAHCLLGVDVEYVTTVLGALDLDNSGDHIVRNVRAMYSHPDFAWDNNPMWVLHDVGLLELESDVQYSDVVKPVCIGIESSMTKITENECFILGWGKKSFIGSQGGVLQEARVRILDNETCMNGDHRNALQTWIPNYENICVQPENSGKTCSGDSGGPLLCNRNGLWDVIGVASFSQEACIRTSLPSVYNALRNSVHWIHHVCDCWKL